MSEKRASDGARFLGEWRCQAHYRMLFNGSSFEPRTGSRCTALAEDLTIGVLELSAWC
jgi:hypothetical protein